jgi:hypothetical protein
MSTRKHLIQDLAPYVCISETCFSRNKVFFDKRQWMDHILVEHSETGFLRTNTCPLCGEKKAENEENALLNSIAKHLEEISLLALPLEVDEEGFESEDSSQPEGLEYSIFIGDLGPEVNESILKALFQHKYPSTKSAKIVSDPIPGMSCNYGFVWFTSEAEQQSALSNMQGVYAGSRPMCISTAYTTKKCEAAGAHGATDPKLGSKDHTEIKIPSETVPQYNPLCQRQCCTPYSEPTQQRGAR